MQNAINEGIVTALFHGAGLGDVCPCPNLIFEYRDHYGPYGHVCSIVCLGIPGFIQFVSPEFVAALPNASKTPEVGRLPVVVRNVIVVGWDGPEGLPDGSEQFAQDEAEMELYDQTHPEEADESDTPDDSTTEYSDDDEHVLAALYI